jgi:hypothetical protein
VYLSSWITLYIIKNRWDVTVKNKIECIVACVNIHPVYSSLWYFYRVNRMYINICNNTLNFVFNNFISSIFNNIQGYSWWQVHRPLMIKQSKTRWESIIFYLIKSSLVLFHWNILAVLSVAAGNRGSNFTTCMGSNYKIYLEAF